MVDALAKAFQEGGLFMYFIALCSAFALTIIVERALQLFLRFGTNVDVTGLLASTVRNGKVAPELAEIEERPSAPALKMAKRIAAAVPFGPRAIVDAAIESRIEVNPIITSRVAYISMFANVATLLGLLGTIVGLIAAFAGVAAADPAKKQQMLATGISVAMNTTAYGLMVAIPCMLSHAILMSRTNKVMEDADAVEQQVMGIIGELHPEVMDALDEAQG